MKRLLIAFASVSLAIMGGSSAAAQNANSSKSNANSAPSSADIPAVISVDNKEAPRGAVIQLTLRPGFEPESVWKYQLQIGLKDATFTVLQGSTSTDLKVAAIVPDDIELKPETPPGKAVPVPIIFFTDQGHGGNVFSKFSVIPPLEKTPMAQVEIVSVRKQENTSYFDVRFDDDIPPELWGQVKIFIDDRPVEKIVQMSLRFFSFEIPRNLPSATSHDMYVKVGYNSSSIHKLNSIFTSDYTARASPTPTPASMPAKTSTESPFSSRWITLLSVALALVGLALAVYYYRKSIRDRSLALWDTPPNFEEDLHLPEELPPSLVEACAAGECVLYAGAGLSAQSGLPTWREFVFGLLDWAKVNGFVSEEDADSLQMEVRRGQADPVADSIVSRLKTKSDQDLLNNYLRNTFLKKSSPSAFHTQLKQIKFSSVLTTNFDNILEGIYETQSGRIYTPKETDSLLAALTKREFFILKLYGSLDQPDTVMVAPAQYEEEIRGNSPFSRFMQTLFLSRTLLFVGASMEGIETYLKGITFPKDLTRTHYALVGVTDSAWRAKADFLERRYGIKVLPYTPKEGYAELGDFLSKLTETVAARQNADTDVKRETSRLKRLTLENIGPFDNLEMEFDLKSEHQWHIFLGDNGVGKSTVLKAIAFALCGEKAQPYAARLLKGGKSEGKITLETDNGTIYTTTIKRKSSGEVIIVGSEDQAQPLEAEGWLAVGFPPLRTTSWEPLKGPDPEFKIKSRPVVDDLLPLVKGDVDPRLDKLKQWIVNLDYENLKSKGRDGHYQGLIQKVFDILGSVAEGMKLNYRGVDEEKRILIETDDGASIPLEALSQGTISLMGWIGILMQRLHEVFDQDQDPTQRYALVLMDEIDAHMHPLWQRTLVNHLKDTFPKAQFIATTHSPLVVGGMPAKQVVRFARDENGKAVILPIALDMTLGYTDQVLTSPLFSLPTTLDDTTKRMMNDYQKLDEMKDRSAREEEKHESLRQELMVRIPREPGSYEKTHEAMLSKAKLLKEAGEKLREVSPEGGNILLARADKMLSTLEGGESNDSN